MTHSEVFKIKKSDFINCSWIDKDTFSCYLNIPNKLRPIFSEITVTDEYCFLAEYWKDKDSLHYILMFEDDVVPINHLIECDYLNDIILKLSIETSK